MIHGHPYKCLHEEFLMNLTGTNPVEVSIVISCAPLAVLMKTLFSLLFFSNDMDKTNSKNISTKFLLDFSTVVLPILFCLTILADYLALTMSSFLCLASGLLVLVQNIDKDPCKPQPTLHDKDRLSYITIYRGLMFLITAICILAVDFPIFPRRYAKTETFGFSVMDVGVGSFILANAIICPEARQLEETRCWKSKRSNVLTSIKSSCPLLFMGFLRLFSLKSVDYHEHISEYGTHWNFFFTLAVVKIFSSLCWFVFDPSMSGILSFILIISYQFFLSCMDLEHFILMGTEHGGRKGFLNANREGILSSWGYLGLFFMGVELGRYMFKSKSENKSAVNMIWELCAMDAIFWFLAFVSHMYIEYASRRIMNMAYCTWTMALTIHLLICIIAVELISDSVVQVNKVHQKKSIHQFEGVTEIPLTNSEETAKPPGPSFCLLEAVNKHGLFFFLLANVLTGLINIFVKTIHTSSNAAISILIVYMLIPCVLVTFFCIKEIRTKVW